MKLSHSFCVVMLLLVLGHRSVFAEEPKVHRGFPAVNYVIDTHIHLYDTRRPKGVPWQPKSDRVLYKPHYFWKNAATAYRLKVK